MCSSEASFSLSLHSNPRFLYQRSLNSCFSANPFFIKPRKSSPFSVTASIATRNSIREFSWVSWDRVAINEYNGWEVEESSQKPVTKKSLSKLVAVGIGASFVGLLAYFAISSYGLRIRSSFHALHGFKLPFVTSKDDITSEEVSSDGKMGDADLPEDHANRVSSDSLTGIETTPATMKEQNIDRILVPFTVDSVQQEALSVLKKLKIIEDDSRGDELCTRREYARWFVRANSQLERSREHQVIPSAALSGSRIIAFDDVSTQDPDFEYIQSLAEAGIVRSKLSDANNGLNLNANVETDSFFPERFISRQDLVSWKAKTEYKVMPEISAEMSRKNIGFLDVKAISSDSLSEVFVDFLANEKSILRGIFGQCRRLQPNKPCTKGQAAVALTCGRLSEFIRTEISRLEAENITRQLEMKEAKSELLERGEIKDFWERKMEEERSRGMEVEQDYHTSATDLELEKTFQENSLAELLKQQVALDCQKQLLSTLNSEVTEMSERFNSERVQYLDEQTNVQKMRNDLETHYEAVLDAKSVLEAEVEALRILRSWVEDEARKSQGRAKVLEEAGRRWKWEN